MAMTLAPRGIAAVLLALLGGCQEPYEANWLFRGQWIDVDGRDREADETCAGTFEYLDRYAGAVAVEFGVTEHLGVVRWYSPEQYQADAPCGTDPEPYACAWYDGADTPALPHEHEVVHLAEFRSGDCPSLLAEGLADYYSISGRTPSTAGLGRLAALLEDPAATIPTRDYPAAARFVAYLVERFGVDAVLQICKATGRHPTRDELANTMASVFGVGTDALLADFASQPASCNSFEKYQSRVYACGIAEAAPHAGVAGQIPGDTFERTYEFDCAHASTIGPLGGEIWITERIDLVANGTYFIGLDRGPSSNDISEVELTLAQCEPCGHVRAFEPGEFIGPETFEAGRYWLELRAPAGYVGTPTVSIQLHEVSNP